VVFHPKLNMFASASPDNIKQWRCPNGEFIQVRAFPVFQGSKFCCRCTDFFSNDIFLKRHKLKRHFFNAVIFTK